MSKFGELIFFLSNTYTNKTWSEVSGIGLEEVTQMELEFLKGIDFNLYVNQETYESWRDLLKGLVMAKERDRRQWRRTPRSHHRSAARPLNTMHSSAALSSKSYYPLVPRFPSHRARSTSPSESRSFTYNFEFTAPSITQMSQDVDLMHSHVQDHSPTPRPGSKRQAEEAFSPVSTSFPDYRPNKRPSSMSLVIPEYPPPIRASPHSVSPLEPLHAFSQMSLGSSPNGSYTQRNEDGSSPAWISYQRADDAPRTLVAPYHVEQPVEMPQVRSLFR